MRAGACEKPVVVALVCLQASADLKTSRSSCHAYLHVPHVGGGGRDRVEVLGLGSEERCYYLGDCRRVIVNDDRRAHRVAAELVHSDLA